MNQSKTEEYKIGSIGNVGRKKSKISSELVLL